MAREIRRRLAEDPDSLGKARLPSRRRRRREKSRPSSTFPKTTWQSMDLPSSRSVKRPSCCKSSKGSKQMVCGTVIVHRITAPCLA